MISKFIKNVLVTTLALGLFIIQVNTAEASTKVMWGKTELKLGQIGKVTILERTQLVKPTSDAKYESVRILYPGDEFRVYQYKGQDGGLYGVGGGSFVQKNNLKVKYETPSKSKLDLVNKHYVESIVTDVSKEPVVTDVTNIDTNKQDLVVNLPTGGSITIRNAGSTVPSKPKYEPDPLTQEVIDAEKAFNKIVSGEYSTYITEQSRALVVKKGDEDIISYSYSDGKYENDGKPRHYLMNFETDKESNELSYKLLNSIGFPLSKKEYFNVYNKSQKDNEAILKDGIYMHAIGPHTQVRWETKK